MYECPQQQQWQQQWWWYILHISILFSNESHNLGPSLGQLKNLLSTLGLQSINPPPLAVVVLTIIIHNLYRCLSHQQAQEGEAVLTRTLRMTKVLSCIPVMPPNPECPVVLVRYSATWSPSRRYRSGEPQLDLALPYDRYRIIG